MRLSQVVYRRSWELGWGVGGGVEWKVKMSNRIIWLGYELQKYVRSYWGYTILLGGEAINTVVVYFNSTTF